MATSNIYKPGWRSRRRSRLSLVERAVPRLGRVSVPENRSIADTTAALPKPSAQDEASSVDPRDRDEPGFQEAAPSSTEAAANDGKPSSLSLPVPVTAPTLTLAPEEKTKDKAAEAELAAEAVDVNEAEDVPFVEDGPDSDDEFELDVDTLVTGDASSADETVDQTTSTSLVPVSDQPPVAETEHPKVESKVIDGGWSTKDDPAPISQSIPGDRVQLDWDGLIQSGLVDPRDRARPLPAAMDDVSRALVRQALSDQSSWRDRIILVSSAREGRAKSMAALNFAFALTTIDNHSVVLLDANMDGSGAVSHVKAPNHPGLTTALCDSTIEIDEITLETDLDRLTLVTSGAFEEDILDRFASRRMLEILRTLTKDPDTLLVLDAPPILSSQESAVLSVIAGQVALVVEAGVTDETSINQALKRIGDRHNLSLVLSRHAGIRYDETVVERPAPANQIPLPVPRKSTSKRLRRAIASLSLGLVFGINGWLQGSPLPVSALEQPTSLTKTPLPERSTFKTKPIPPQTGGIDR